MWAMSRLIIFIALLSNALSYSTFVAAGLNARGVGSVVRIPTLRGGNTEKPSALIAVASASPSEPVTREAAQQ
jgi:hypothetical protein